MHIVVFKELACSHLHDNDMVARLFPSSLVKEAFEWFYILEDQSITSYSQLKREFVSQYQHNMKRRPNIVDLAKMKQQENQSFEKFVIAWKKVARFINLNEKELKQMLIKSLRDEMILEFFNYLEQPLPEMILSML